MDGVGISRARSLGWPACERASVLAYAQLNCDLRREWWCLRLAGTGRCVRSRDVM
jgi:hypothetical protein